jgi:hypothetical protein
LIITYNYIVHFLSLFSFIFLLLSSLQFPPQLPPISLIFVNYLRRLKKKKGGFFTSITSLQKNSAKYSTKREQLDEKSTGARNDYLLCLAAANAHQNRYFVVDLQLCMTTMESGVYEKIAEYISFMGRTELLTCSAMQNSFTVIRDQAKQLSREYNLQCCYLYYPVLKQHIQYPFESCDNDPVDTITAEHDSAAATLSKEARRWATRIARENNIIRESARKLQIYSALRESGQRVDPNDQNGPDLETKIEEMRLCIRKAETAKTKAEARIEVLREGGVNVDEWLQEAESLNVQDIQRSASSLSDHPSSDSFYDSDFADGETTTTPQVDKQQDKDSEGSQQDQFENAAEVDGEWGRQRTRSYTLCLAWYRCAQLQANVCSCRFSRFLVRLAIHQHRDESRQKDTVLSLESLFLVRSYFGIMLLKAMGNYCTTTNNFKYDDSLPHSFCHKLLFSIFPSQFSPESRHFSHARARKTTHRTVDGRLGRSHSSRLGYRRTSRNDRDGHPTTRIHPFHPPAQMHSALLVHGKTSAISV